MKDTVFLPAIALRGLVVFPSMVLHFDVGRERSANALKAAAESDGRIFLAPRRREKVFAELTEAADDEFFVGARKVPDGADSHSAQAFVRRTTHEKHIAHG